MCCCTVDSRRRLCFSVLSVLCCGSRWDGGDDCKTVVACAGGRQVWWSVLECLGCGFLEIGRNPRRLGTDAVTPTGAAFLPEGRRVGCISSLPLVRTGGTPRMVPGVTHGAVRAAASKLSLPFLEVLLGSRRLRKLGVWWKISSEGAAVESYHCFRRTAGVGIVFFLFCFVSFGLDLCCLAPAVVS